jgi:hypothetical protein
MTNTELETSEPRALLERRANVRMARLGRLLEAIGRRRVSTVREAVLDAKIAGVAIALGAIAMTLMYMRGRARRRARFIHRLAERLDRLSALRSAAVKQVSKAMLPDPPKTGIRFAWRMGNADTKLSAPFTRTDPAA